MCFSFSHFLFQTFRPTVSGDIFCKLIYFCNDVWSSNTSTFVQRNHYNIVLLKRRKSKQISSTFGISIICSIFNREQKVEQAYFRKTSKRFGYCAWLKCPLKRKCDLVKHIAWPAVWLIKLVSSMDIPYFSC